jgi:hypothetical protein
MGTPSEENKPNVSPPPQPTALGKIVGYCSLSNVGDAIAYLLIAGSLFYCFFNPFIGELPVGFIMGLYFSRHIFNLATQFREFLIKDGVFRGFIIIAAIASLIIAAPGLSLGLVVGVFIRPLFGHQKPPEEEK